METLEKRALMAAAIMDGDWSNPATWDSGSVPDENTPVLISHGVTVQLDGADHAAENLVIHGNLVVPEEDLGSIEANKTLTTQWVHINSGGLFQVGTEIDRYDSGTFSLQLTGTDIETDKVVQTNMMGMNPGTMTIQKNDGFLMTGGMGRVQFFGEDKVSFTKLAANVDPDSPGSDSIVVANVIERNFSEGESDANGFETSAADDGELNWEIGDQIVIASSSYDYTEQEVRTIVGITPNADGETSTLLLDEALIHRHYGQIETYAAGTDQPRSIDLRAEVALLSRNVKIHGLASQDTDIKFGDRANMITEPRVRAGGLTDAEHAKAPPTQVANGIGGHIMIMPTSGPIKIDGVQLDGLGQASQKGRYPIHWHLGDSRPSDFLKNTSITNSNNRGVTIHGTSDLTIEGVVLHDIHGHGFFFEDAVETGNKLVANLAIGIHTVGGNDNSAADPGEKDPFVVDTHDSVLETGSRFSSSAGFWITHPDNVFVGNIVAGMGDQRTDDWAGEPGPAGTGFWYALPRVSLGASSEKAIYADMTPIYGEFGTFDYNTSHTTAVGLNFDRGSDIEDATFLSNPDLGAIQLSNVYSPRIGGVKEGAKTTNVIQGFTNYKASDAAFYHRGDGEQIQLKGLAVADSYNGPWAVSENTYTDSLFIGHSKGNADTNAEVGGPRLYDGAGLYIATHFAGFGGPNAYAFQVEGSSFGPTMYHAFQGTSFEDDGTVNNLAHAVSDFSSQIPGRDHNEGQPSEWIKAVMDLDGTLTSAFVGGGIGTSIVPDVDFLVDDDDTLLPGGGAWLTDDIYARVRIQNFDDGEALFPPAKTGDPLVIFTAEDGDEIRVIGGQEINNMLYWTQIATKADSDADGFVDDTFTVEFGRKGLPPNGFVLNMDNQDGGRPELVSEIADRVNAARLVTKFVGAGNYTPSVIDNGIEQTVEVASESALRSVTDGVAYFRDDAGNLLLNTSIVKQDLVNFLPGDPLQTVLGATTPLVQRGSVIQAELFDNGIDGIAYHDNDTTNSFGSFRNDTGVDATPTTIGDIADGEWLEYTANITPDGYGIGVNFSSTVASGKIHVKAAVSNSAGFLKHLGTIDVTNTGGEFQTGWIHQANLIFVDAEADSVIRLEFEGNFADDFVVDSIHFGEPVQTAYEDRTDLTIDAGFATSEIKLVHFDNGGQGVAYFDTTPTNLRAEDRPNDRPEEDVDHNGDIVTNEVNDGEWLEYTVDIQAGLFDVTLEKRWGGGVGAGLKLLVADANTATEFTELGVFEFTSGGGENLTLENIDLSPWAGADRVIRVEVIGDNMGIDKLTFVSKSAGDQTAPQVESVVVNDGGTQRSMVKSLTVTFNEAVSGVDANAFVLTNTDTNSQIVPIVNTQIIGGKTIATLTFNGPGIIGGSLADGSYTLTTLAAGITDTAGNALDGNDDGIGGDDATDAFFRLFGDADGNGQVNIVDFFGFRNAFRGIDTDTDAFDFNGDGVVNIIDFFRFRSRFGNSI